MNTYKLPNYRVWSPMDDSEKQGFLSSAPDNEEAAEEYVEELINNGCLGDTVKLELHVRDLNTLKVTIVDVTIDYDPVVYANVRK